MSVKSPGECGYCDIMVPAARHLVSSELYFCDDSCRQNWARRTTARVINITQELKMDCCYTVEEIHRSRFEELKEIAMNLIKQIKSQFLGIKDKIRKAKIHLINELHDLIQKLLRVLGIEEKEDFSLAVPAE